MRRAVFLLALCTIFATAGTASAAELRLQYLRTEPAIHGSKYGPGEQAYDVYAVVVDAAPGEANRIEIDAAGRVRDDGAPLRPAPECAVDVDGWGTCAATTRPGAGVSYVLDARTGDGGDRLTIAAPGPRSSGLRRGDVELGPGDDAAETGRFFGTVRGGDGADTMVSRAVDASDRPSPRSTQTPTVWDGGSGPDSASGDALTASYATRAAAVRVTPDGVADDGAPGEGDDVGGDIAVIVGGHGNDELHSAGWAVDGGPGNDHVVGRAGNRAGLPSIGGANQSLVGNVGDDVLEGGSGDEYVHGGPGRDELAGGDGRDTLDGGADADRVDAGPGDDLVDVFADGAPDVWLGGSGRDRVSLNAESALPTAISVDGRANDGLVAEGDDVGPGWERLHVQDGRLVGSDADEELTVDGRGSSDGRGGDDVLIGGETAIGGPGRDVLQKIGAAQIIDRRGARIDTRDGMADAVGCSRGVSVVRLRRDRSDRVSNCFSLAFERGRTRPRPLRATTMLPFDVRCPGHQRCHGRMSVFAGNRKGPRVLTVPFSVPAGKVHRARVRLGSAARPLRRSCGRAELVVTTRSPYTRGETDEITQARDFAPPGKALDACRKRRGQRPR